jgi:hypothetical protein
MALDTYQTVWSRVLLRCPSAGSLLARDWVKDAFRRVAERRRWSWLIKRGQFLAPAVHSAGTATVVNNNATVTGVGATAWTAAMVGRQFKVSANPIYTIDSVNVGAQTLVLDDTWGGASAASIAYEIYQCYFTPPTDFHALVSVYDPKLNWQLYLNYTQREINTWDSQRANRGQAWVVAAFDYRIPTGGTIPLPRFELWPHQTAQYVYALLYEARPTDLQDSGATLPFYVRGDALLEGALAMAARWPGPDADHKNPYFNIQLASMHDARFEQMVMELEKQDDNTYEDDVSYLAPTNYPFVPFADSAWLQSHSF